MMVLVKNSEKKNTNRRNIDPISFMPLIVVDEFKTLDEAVAKVNDTEYGLTAGIFSEDSDEVQ